MVSRISTTGHENVETSDIDLDLEEIGGVFAMGPSL